MGEQKLPNILFLMSDEHRYDITGYAGDTVVRTPTLNRIASEGVQFENCYTPSPICVPARQAMMSGQSCKNCHCRSFNSDLEPFYNTFANWLGRYGYYTVVSGKLHHRGKDQMQGWIKRISGDIQVEMRPKSLSKRKTHNALSGKWSDAKEIARAGIWDGITMDDDSVEGAIKFINNYFLEARYDRPNGEIPLLLKVSLLNPHYPYFAKTEQFNYYLNRVKPNLNEAVFDHPWLSQRQVTIGEEVNVRDVTRATAAYYGMIEEVDTNYARVMKALEEVGQDLDDWLIIYTSDHGEMLGSHGIWEKQKFFEESVKVPLLMRAPKRFAHRVVTENVNTCDIYATLCDFVGIPVPEGLDSRSLVPLMEGKAEDWDNISISHLGENGDENFLMIKKDDLKYQYYGQEKPEVLFDLAIDPKETINFAQDKKYCQCMQEFRAMVPLYLYDEALCDALKEGENHDR